MFNFSKSLKLNEIQLEKISDICINTGIVVLASNIVPLFNQAERADINFFMPSLALVAGFWIFGIMILKGER